MQPRITSQGELHRSFSKSNPTAIMTYNHKGHTKTPKFSVTQEVQKYIRARQLLFPRLIYQDLIQ
ncbi:hypothetical protein V1515DRAFT_591878 [Lipomyces mesembrius]